MPKTHFQESAMILTASRIFSTLALCVVATSAALAQTPTTATPAATTKSATTKETKNSHAGKVWVNLDSKIYHCEGDRHFGTTKNGDYMTLAEAKAQGMTAAKNSKNCKE